MIYKSDEFIKKAQEMIKRVKPENLVSLMIDNDGKRKSVTLEWLDNE